MTQFEVLLTELLDLRTLDHDLLLESLDDRGELLNELAVFLLLKVKLLGLFIVIVIDASR